MTSDFTPRLDILPPPQRRLWDELSAVPPEFVLYGGTALALHLGHRASMDFDFFGNKPLDPSRLVPAVPFLGGAARGGNPIRSVARAIVVASSNCRFPVCREFRAYRRH